MSVEKRTQTTLFVTGTDTEAGKTYVCGALLQHLRSRGVDASYQKLVSTGAAGIPEDLRSCLTAAGQEVAEHDLELLVPYRFRLPASPHLAAEQEGRLIDPELLLARYHQLAASTPVLIVEGVGGVLVPLRRDLLLADFLGRLRLPTLVVARSGLGTLNHTLLTLEALRTRGIPILGVVLSDGTPFQDELIAQDNLRTIAELGQVRVFGRVRHGGARAAEPVWEAVAAGVLGQSS